jgi:hypothetical protein
MATFWLTFRIEDRNVGGRTYDDRRNALYEAVRTRASRWWVKPTSYVAFESQHSLDDLAGACRSSISPAHDLFLIREMDSKNAIICGNNDDKDIYILMPYLRTL